MALNLEVRIYTELICARPSCAEQTFLDAI